MPDTTLPQDEITKVKAEAQRLTTGESHQRLTDLYKRYEEIYFMTANEKPRGNNIDDNDWKVTISPTGRNAVTGMKRLLDTSEIHVTITDASGDTHPNSNKIERALKQILDQSGMMRRARVEKDLNLSATLYGPAVIAAEKVDDLITVQKDAAQKKYLQKIGLHTPFLLKALNASESFSRWGEFGMSAHLRKYKLSGPAIEERWGVSGLSAKSSYWIWDWIDRTNRVAWIEGRRETLIAKPHMMDSINIAARFAGGTSLWNESDKFSQSFLYAHTKGEWDRRENLFYTYLFTALFVQGLPGPLLLVDPESLQGADQTLKIDYTGGVRKIYAKAQATNFPVVDGDTMRIKEILDAVNNDSTIYKQTLGQAVEGSTFSGLAMMSSAGTLPLEDPKEAIEGAFRDIFDHILCRVKYEGIEHPILAAADIPDDYIIIVTMKPKLPQDDLRNAQVAANLGDLVSDEWKHTNLLQIGDSDAMRKQVVKEQMLKTMIQAMLADPGFMQEMIAVALRKPPAAPPPPAIPPGNQAAPPDEAMLQQQENGQPMIDPSMAQGQPNMIQAPMGGPMPMPGEQPLP